MSNGQDSKKLNNSELVIENKFSDQINGSSKIDSFYYLQEVFKDKLDHDVVYMIFAENDYNVEATLENLFILVNETDTEDKYYAQCKKTFSSSFDNAQAHFSNQKHKNIVYPCSSHKSYSSALAMEASSSSILVSTNKSQHFFKNNINIEENAIKSIKQAKRALVLMRGLPGSGKTTLAHKIIFQTSGIRHSTDDYFTMRDGSYCFDSSFLTIAHNWNLKKAYESMKSGISPVVIDNTNLEIWEMKPYIFYAFDFNYQIFFMEPFTSWRYNVNRLSRVNRHGLTKEKLQKSLEKFEIKINTNKLIESLQKDYNQVRTNSSNKNPFFNEKQIKDKKKQTTSSSIELNALANLDKVFQNEQHNWNFRSKNINQRQMINDNDNKDDCEYDKNNENNNEKNNKSINNEDNDNNNDVNNFNENDNRTDNIIKKNTVANLSNLQKNVFDAELKEHAPLSLSFCEKLINNVPNSTQMVPKPQRSFYKFCKVNKNEALSPLKKDFSEPWESYGNKTTISNHNYNSHNNLKRSNKLLVSMNLNQTNWQFPAFPIENFCNQIENDVDIVKDFITIATQTENRNWAMLKMQQLSSNSDNTYNFVNFSSNKNNSISKKECFKNRIVRDTHRLRLDKGTSTEDLLINTCYNEKLYKLKHHFPQEMENNLREILDTCHGDYQWANNFLTLFSDEHFNAKINYSFDKEFYLSRINKSCVQNEYPFLLKINSDFAQQLEENFGSFLEANKSTDECYSVNIDRETAKNIYDLWKKSYNQLKFSIALENPRCKSNSTKFKKNKLIVEKLTPDISALQPKSPFQEIMDLEMAYNLSRQEFYNSINSLPTCHKDLLSTKLKRDQLKTIYPGLDEQALEEVFEANSFKISDTIKTIDETFGLQSNLSPELQEQMDEQKFDLSENEQSTQPISSIENMQSFEKVRSEIMNWSELKKEYMEKAKLSYKSKKYAIASYYSDQARDCQFKIDKLRQSLIKVVVSNSKNQLDLHGFHSNEVVSTLASYLASKQEELEKFKLKKMHLDIITGRGIHSQFGPKIKPIVINYLHQKKYKFETINDGFIRIIITQ